MTASAGSPATPSAPLDTPTLARNVVHFVRVLRSAGLPMSPAQAVDALAALHWIDLGRRDDVRAALATLLVRAPDERDLFNAVVDDGDMFGAAIDADDIRALQPLATAGRRAVALLPDPAAWRVDDAESASGGEALSALARAGWVVARTGPATAVAAAWADATEAGELA